MLSSILQYKIEQSLQTRIIEIKPVSGGSINKCYQLKTRSQLFFCKVNSATKFPQLFRKEKAALHQLKHYQIFHIPDVVDYYETNEQQVLILSWIESGEKTNAFWDAFGERLAALHFTSSPHFGADEDNYMGSIPQSNTKHLEWNSFFIEERLRPLVQQAFSHGLLNNKQVHLFENLYQQLPLIFNPEPPALLHGDLWSGNFMCNATSEPVLIDPAVYFGHRSVDLGMTTLFGGFSSRFYDAYKYHYPFPENYSEQWSVANLYPLLIHLLLFGPAYNNQIEVILKKYGSSNAK